MSATPGSPAPAGAGAGSAMAGISGEDFVRMQQQLHTAKEEVILRGIMALPPVAAALLSVDSSHARSAAFRRTWVVPYGVADGFADVQVYEAKGRADRATKKQAEIASSNHHHTTTPNPNR